MIALERNDNHHRYRIEAGPEAGGATVTGPGHAGAGHGAVPGADRRWLGIALALISTFMVAEVVVGVLAHSLALLSDSAHMLTDAGSLLLALIAIRLAARPPRRGYTFGLKRAEILSAQANGFTLLGLAVWLGYEAVRRLIAPEHVVAGPVVATALAGIAVNLAAARAISRANRSSLNVEGAFRHVVTDLVGFIGTAAAGLVIMITGFARADAIATLLVVALMMYAGTGLVRDSGRIFLEAAPPGLDPDALGDRMAAYPQVVEVHDLHVWLITSGQPALSAHILVQPAGDCHAVRRGLERLLREQYNIDHVTLQLDHAPADLARATANGTAVRDHANAECRCAEPHGAVHRPGPHPH